MRIRFAFIDRSSASFVITCAACPHWAAIRLDQLEAYQAKAQHDINVHGVEEARARDGETRYLQRHADAR